MSLNDKINQWLNSGDSSETRLNDNTKVNFFVMIIKKVLNLTFLGCDFSVITKDTQAKPLEELCKDLQKNCYKIGALMLGGSETQNNRSECWCVPCFEMVNGSQKLFHDYLGGDRIMITAMKAGQITECYMVLEAVKRNHKTYILYRKHKLDGNGNLTISYSVRDENAREVSGAVPEWEGLVLNEVTYPQVNHIGFGRYKSPVLSTDKDVYGKPLNYNCSEIENKIQTCLKQIQDEFEHKGVRLFADESIVKTRDANGKPTKANVIDEFIYPIKNLSGVSQTYIQSYSEQIRESSYYAHLTELLNEYEALCGVNNILTRAVPGATATEIKMLNKDTVATVYNIRKAIREGNIETLKADSIYLGIPLNMNLWNYDETWQEVFEDEQQTLENNIKLYEQGAIELRDLVSYWFPTLTPKEIDKKIERIKVEKHIDSKSSIESMLNM